MTAISVPTSPIAEQRPGTSGHWQRYGRNIYSRHDCEELDSAAAHGCLLKSD